MRDLRGQRVLELIVDMFAMSMERTEPFFCFGVVDDLCYHCDRMTGPWEDGDATNDRHKRGTRAPLSFPHDAMSAAFLKTKLKALKESLAAKEWSTVSKAASSVPPFMLQLLD